MQLGLADFLAAVARRVLPAMHGRVRENVRIVLGAGASAAEVELVARMQWRNYLRYMRDFAALPHIANVERQNILGSVEGWEHIVEAMGQGRGAVLVSAHFGNWDLAAGTMALHYPVNVIADTFASTRVDAAINERRRALGLQVIPIEKAIKRTVSALRRNEAVAFLVDKPVGEDDGVEVTFFGRRTRVPGGAAYFASRLRAPLLVAFVWRRPDRTFEAHVLPPVSTEGTLHGIMQRVMDAVEGVIKEHPENWYMFRRMWPQPSVAKAGRPASDVPAGCVEEAVA